MARSLYFNAGASGLVDEQGQKPSLVTAIWPSASNEVRFSQEPPSVDPVINYNIPIFVTRQTDHGPQTLAMKAVVDADKLFLPVDADIEQGDEVAHDLPNGKTRRFRITKVDVYQSPFGSGGLDHTEAHYTTDLTPLSNHRTAGDTFNVHATNVQVATGDHSQQTMTVSQTAEQLDLVMEGISELLRSLNLLQGSEKELAELRAEALDDVSAEEPSATGVRRFCEWVTECAKSGATSAVAAAITAASNGLLHDAEGLVQAVIQ